MFCCKHLPRLSLACVTIAVLSFKLLMFLFLFLRGKSCIGSRVHKQSRHSQQEWVEQTFPVSVGDKGIPVVTETDPQLLHNNLAKYHVKVTREFGNYQKSEFLVPPRTFIEHPLRFHCVTDFVVSAKTIESHGGFSRGREFQLLDNRLDNEILNATSINACEIRFAVFTPTTQDLHQMVYLKRFVLTRASAKEPYQPMAKVCDCMRTTEMISERPISLIYI